MEGLRKRVITLGIVFIALGAIFIFTSKPTLLRDEKWMIENTPRQVGSYTMIQRDAGPDITYKMDEATYDTLKPYGIVARVLQFDQKAYDTVVIMSNRKESFHDPRVCFTAQGWSLVKEEVKTIQTKKHGPIQITLAVMDKDGRKSLSTFFYRGPKGFCPTTNALKWQMFFHQCKTLSDAEGAFYRVIPLHDAATEAELYAFIDQFLTETDKSSGGLL